MSGALYIFNPENDLSVANGGENYMPPPRARIIAEDLAFLPVWYAENGDDVIVPSERYIDWMHSERASLGCFSEVVLKGRLPDKNWTACIPWGWSPEIARRFLRMGVSDRLLPGNVLLKEQKRLHHRNQTLEILKGLRDYGIGDIPDLLPEELYTTESVCRYIQSAPLTVLKAPWSGSGKGLSWGRGVYDTTLERWSRGILRRQGSIMGEPFYEKVQDFAMEFHSDGVSSVVFAGYSLFDTNKKGVYTGNILTGDDDILSCLSIYVATERIESVKIALQELLSVKVAPYYKGYFGIDMMIYKENGKYRLNPCIELNLRMNMGVVSRIFYDRYTAPGSKGIYVVDYNPDSAALYTDHLTRTKDNPLIIHDGKIIKGYLSLSPLTPESHYRARVEIY
jgi:hypothetical protein